MKKSKIFVLFVFFILVFTLFSLGDRIGVDCLNVGFQNFGFQKDTDQKLIEQANKLKNYADKLDSERKNNEAIKYYQMYGNLCKKLQDNKGIYYAYVSMGICYKREKNFAKAFEYYQKALVAVEKIKDRNLRFKKKAAMYTNLGSLFEVLRFYKKSIEFYKMSNKYREKAKDYAEKYVNYLNIGQSYSQMGKLDLAVKYSLLAYNYFFTQKDYYNLCFSANNLAYQYLKAGNLNESQKFHNIALKLALERGYNDMLPYIYSGLGELYFAKGDFKNSLKYQNLAEKIAEDDFEVLRTIYMAFYKLYSATGDLDKAAKYRNKYEKLAEEFFDYKNFEKVEDFMSYLVKEKNRQKMLVLEKEKKIRELVAELSILALFLALIILGFLYYRYKTKQKINAYLDMLSKKDPLTNLYNRRAILEIIDIEKERFERTKRPFCISICDIDYFKKVNDTYGHSIGDIVLKGIASILKENLRNTDFVARWGGEEFLIFLPETDIKAAEKVLEKLRKLAESKKFSAGKIDFNVTLTFGVCEFQKSVEHTIELADKALYKGKKSGKNKVVVCEI
ncbi:signal transduction protein [Thermotomaculum hydrothermale]|uniref:diguanylate cyclase n=1 Tax=Thermotomaculum hydrothermale TaxID=981385 RepID=A0A7R6PYZ7_9BACT|nr:tetratricopeptide repeat-containing diguanylate cyclase [Thermotomaculum hydrothermale]BBB33470.1 signal transduction protein [Thermotomaculum hydrothermale]